MTSYKRKIRSLRRRILKNMTKLLEDINKKLANGESLGSKEMFTLLAGPLVIEQLTVDKAFGEVDLITLKEVFELLIDFPISFKD